MFKADPANFSVFRGVIQMIAGRYFIGPWFYFFHRLRIEGRENVPEEPLVYVSNHNSLRDPPLMVIATECPMCYIGKKELFKSFWLGRLLTFLGVIPLNRERPEKEAFRAIKQIIKNGWSIGLFVEGTRSKTPGVMGQPHNGAAYFAKSNKLRIMPIGIIGSRYDWGQITVRVGKPMDATGELEDITWQIMQALSDLTGDKLPERNICEDAPVPVNP